MKNIIKSLFIAVLLVSSPLVYAQEAPVQSQHDRAIMQLISLLLEQVKLLQQQLAQLNAQAPVYGSTQVSTSGAVQTNGQSGIISSMKPAYTPEELVVLFNKHVSDLGVKQSNLYNLFPVAASGASSTSEILSFVGVNTNFSDVLFNGQKVLSNLGNEQELTYDGAMIPVHSRMWTSLDNLTPGTEYQYQFVWKEDGREDTVVTNTFKTLDK